MALTADKIEAIKKELMDLGPEEQQAKLQEILATLSPEEREQLVGKQQCPFCLMAQGQIPVKVVYEDDSLMGILDINPANKGHVLLFPKDHAPLLSQVPDSIVGHMFEIANKLSSAVFEALQADGTNILVANGAVAGQSAPHVLINIFPRFEGDKVAIGWEPKKIEEAEMDDVANKIKSAIPKGRTKPRVIQEDLDPNDLPREDTRIP